MGSAAGSERTAASKAGVSVADYRCRVAAGEKWCFKCRDWHLRQAFGRDASRSDGLAAKCLRSRSTGRPKGWHGRPSINPATGRPGPAQQPWRDDDKIQARYRVNKEVRQGKLPSPRSLPCTDCGHVWTSDAECHHEYDHHRGYEADHHLDVEPVCVPCHRKRERARNNGR